MTTERFIECILFLFAMGKLPFENKKREILIRKEAKTSDEFGKTPEERTAEDLLKCGIINLDKPAGPTSHQVSSYVNKILNVKCGHSGTLDPNVTGILPIGVGKGTKVLEYLLNAGKEYVCLMLLHSDVEEENIRKAMEKFVGKIRQLPPVKSAVKRRLRYRTVYYIEILEVEGRNVLFRVGCEAGTYIRKLCTDIGKALGTKAHMAELRRTKTGPFNEDKNLVTLYDIKDAFYYYENGDGSEIRKAILPVERAVEHLPKIWVLDSAVDAICNGAFLSIPGIARLESGIEPDQRVAMMSLKDELIGVGIAVLSSSVMMKKNKGVAVKTDKVIMAKGTYPRMQGRK